MFFFVLSILGCSTESKVPVNESVVIDDSDGDGFTSDEDCNDRDAAVFPGNQEICDGIDNNCDGDIDENVQTEFYADVDQDGFGTVQLTVLACEAPEGFVSTGTDCDDTTADSYPGAEEICDGLDNNCDDAIDEGLLQDFYLDQDGDGFGNEDEIIEACDISLGISSVAGDCDDADPSLNPLATEICDGFDNNCDGQTDEGLLITFYLDQDEDGYGTVQQTLEACTQPEGYVSQSGDCDDIESFANPGIAEVCDGIDNNCDGNIDEDTSLDALEYYVDADGDQFGAGNVILGCFIPAGHTTLVGDCDDANAQVHPSMIEICDGLDNDCDGLTDDSSAVDQSTWYLDADEDGFGTDSSSQTACSQPTGYVEDNTDCDDTASAISPSASEICDSIDNNCDGTIDAQDAAITDASIWYLDHDQDGFGDPNLSVIECEQPSLYVSNSDDCNDLNTQQSPNEIEVCNSLDDNCDGSIDENPSDGSIWFLDADQDGFGLASDVQVACEQPSGYVVDDTDCVDTNDTINPSASEICDGIDNNCSGSIDDDSSIIGVESDCAAQSCLDILEQNASAADGVYWIDPLGSGAFSVFCDMTTSGGGWTLLLKSNGDSFFNYDNTLWTDSNVYNEQSLDTSSANSKFESFVELDITEMMGCFPSEGNHCFFASFNTQNTAQEIFAGGSQQMGTGWNGQSYSGWSWQPNCHYFGINTPYCYRRARFGFTANQENDCSSNDTAIGFGLARTCGTSASENVGSGNLCMSTECSQGNRNVGFLGLLYGR